MQREIAPTSSALSRHTSGVARDGGSAEKAAREKPSTGETRAGVTESDSKSAGEGLHVTFTAVLAIAAALVIGYHVVKKLTRLFFQILLVAGVLFALGLVLTHFHLVTW